MASSKERENFVYVAKLAEQAERYDGQNLLHQPLSFSFIFVYFICKAV